MTKTKLTDVNSGKEGGRRRAMLQLYRKEKQMPQGYHTENGQLVPNKAPFDLQACKYGRNNLLTPFLEAELPTVVECAMFDASEAEIAHKLNFNLKNWLKVKEQHPEIDDAIQAGKAEGKLLIRKMAFKKASEGDTNMIIFLCRAVLGYRVGMSMEANVQNNIALIEKDALANQAKSITDEARAKIEHMTQFLYGPGGPMDESNGDAFNRIN